MGEWIDFVCGDIIGLDIFFFGKFEDAFSDVKVNVSFFSLFFRSALLIYRKDDKVSKLIISATPLKEKHLQIRLNWGRGRQKS